MSRDSEQSSHGRRSRRKVAMAGALAAVVASGGTAALSAQGGGVARAADTATATAAFPSGGYSPQALRRAYGVSALLRKGIDGRGETVVLLETNAGPGAPPADGPAVSNIRQNLAAFDKRFHLPAADLTLGRALGYTGSTALTFGGEETQDAEVVHTIAPAAKITIMLVPGRAFESPAELAPLFRVGAQRGNVISYSQSECETNRCLSAGQVSSLNRALRDARDRHVSIFASSGDSGAATGTVRGVRVPASSPLVTGVGGTTLTAHTDGTDATESAWDDDVPGASSTGARLSASGGGISARWVRPGYQNGLSVIGDHRGVPDVSAVAEPGMATVIVNHGKAASYAAGGTSESSPLWAGIAALADQDAHRQLGFLNAGLYRIGHSPQYHRAFHDITNGNNTVTLPSGKSIDGYSARPGWDPVTGWGSPNAQVLVPLLGKEVRPGDGRGL
jgi:subtilase family serine protease